MKLGLQLGYWQKQPPLHALELTQEAERLGYDSVWTGEAYGSDAFMPLAWIGAHTSKIKLGTSVMQISARTPTCAAMTALTLDHLSGGRLILGIGVSGPQVVEGWYGQPFDGPLERTREWLQIFRQVLERKPVEFQGEHYQLPFSGPGSWGLGKPLKSITEPLRSDIPVYLGAESPRNVSLACECFDGWFPLFMSPWSWDVYQDILPKAKKDFDIFMPSISVNISDNLEEALLPTKHTMALYIGGMGARNRNFHKEHLSRIGFAEEAEKIQQLYLSGDREGAVKAVPDRLADALTLSGPKERIVERLEEWKKTPLKGLAVAHSGDLQKDIETLRFFAESVL